MNRKESSFIGSPKWLKNKKATINPKNNGNNGFQYALTAALTLTLIWAEGGQGGNFTPPPSIWFSLNKSKTVKAVILEICSIQ